MQVEAVSQTLFGRKLADRGFHKKKMGVVRYEGLDLNAESEDSAVSGDGTSSPVSLEDCGVP